MGIPLVDCQSFNTDLNTVLGCDPKTSSLSKGFSVSYYHYPLIPSGSAGCYVGDSQTFLTDEYLHGGYATYGDGLIGSSTGVTDLTFQFRFPGGCLRPILGSLPSNYNNPPQFSMSNFSMLITGYFFAPKTGLYDFVITNGDDVIDINMGDGKAFACCQLENTITKPAPFDISVVWRTTSGSGSFNLVGGYYYPLRIFYMNRYQDAAIKMYFKDPDGVVHNNFDGYVFTIPDGEKCPAPVATTTLPWTFQSTATGTAIGTTTAVDGEAITEDFIVVRLPHIETATAINTPWTGTYTTTVATATTTVTGSDGIPTIETIFSVETPQVKTATTVNTPWTGTYTTTYSTDISTETGADGIPTVKTNFLVETPQVETATTINAGWTGTYTTTYSTTIVTETGADGVPTVKTNFLVETPQVETATTVNIPWTGTYTTTVATATTTVTGVDGIPTIETIFRVETPEVETVTTINVAWTGSYTATYSTELVTTTGADGVITIEAVYHVKTPAVGSSNTKISTQLNNNTINGADVVPNVHTTMPVETTEVGNSSIINSPWTGTYATTYSTEFVTVTGTDGIVTLKAVYHVETPAMASSNAKTPTETSNNSATSADSVINVQTTNHVVTGGIGSTSKVNIPWTGTYTTTYSTGAITSTFSDGIQAVQTAFCVKTPEMSSFGFGYSNSSSTISHSTDSNDNKSLQDETSKPLDKISVTSGSAMIHSMTETNVQMSQETISNRPTTSRNDDEPVPKRHSSANLNTPLGTTMNAVGETSGVVSGMLDTETKGKQSKTMSDSVGQPVTTSPTTSEAASPQLSLNLSIPNITIMISGHSQINTVETHFEGKANKILISPLMIIILAFL